MIVDHPQQRGRLNYKHSCFLFIYFFSPSAGDKKPEYMSYTNKKNVFWSTWRDTVQNDRKQRAQHERRQLSYSSFKVICQHLSSQAKVQLSIWRSTWGENEKILFGTFSIITWMKSIWAVWVTWCDAAQPPLQSLQSGDVVGECSVGVVALEVGTGERPVVCGQVKPDKKIQTGD